MGFSPVGCGGQGKDFPEEVAVRFGKGWWLEFFLRTDDRKRQHFFLLDVIMPG